MVNSGFFRGVFALGLATLVATAWNVQPADAVRHEIDSEGMPAIDIDVQGASVQSTLRMFSEFSGVNIIAGPEVEGDVTARIDGVPWLVALDTLLRTNGYGWEQDGAIIRVTTMDQLNTERLNEEVVERKREDFLDEPGVAPVPTPLVPPESVPAP